MKSYRANGARMYQPPMHIEPEVTSKVGSRPIDVNSMPFKPNRTCYDSMDVGGANRKHEEEKYRSMPSKANTQKTSVNTGDLGFISGGGGEFGARPQLSSQKKANAGVPKSAAKKPLRWQGNQQLYGEVPLSVALPSIKFLMFP
jgi:hypothetical protein